jgi:hypothetical protein
MPSSAGRWLAWALVAALATGGAEPRMLTGKERLGSKAADPQRVNDCKVPPELRDPARPRPTTCAQPPPSEK